MPRTIKAKKISLSDCKDMVIDSLSGKVSPQQVEAIMNTLQGSLDNLSETRLTAADNLVDSQIDNIANEVSKIDLVNQRNSYLTIRAIENLHKFVHAYGSAYKGLLAYLENSRRSISGAGSGVDAVINGWKTKYLGELKARLKEEDLLHDFQHNIHAEDIFKEFYNPGSSGNEKAAIIRNIMFAIKQDVVETSNMFGSFINFRPEHVIKQAYSTKLIIDNFGPDRLKNRFTSGEMTPDEYNQAYKKWKEFIIPLLDEEQTFKEHTPDKVLRGAFDGIMSGKHGAGEEEKRSGAEINSKFFSTGALARKMSVQRLLHFKDGESAFKAHTAMSPQPLSKGFIEELERSAVNVGLMQQLGPNPTATLDATIEDLEQLYSRKHYNNKTGKWEEGADTEQLNGLKKNKHKIQGALSFLDRSALIPHNPTIATATSAAISLLTQAKLGRLLFFAIPDRALMQSSLTAAGVKGLDALSASLSLTLPSNPAERLRLIRMGAELKSFASQVHSRFTTGAEGPIPSWIGKSQKLFFDLTGIHYFDDVGTSAVVESMSRNAGVMSNMAYTSLPDDFRNSLNVYGITTEVWDAWRSTVYHTDAEGKITKGYSDTETNWITPDSFKEIPKEAVKKYIESRGWSDSPDNISRGRKDIESKFNTWLTAVKDEAVLTPGSREHRLSTWGSRPGTVSGSMIRLLMMFKSFPITVYTKIIEREMYQRGATSMGDWLKFEAKSNFHTTQLIAMSLVAGYISLTLDELLQGKKPRKLTNIDGSIDIEASAKLLKDSFLRGGAGSIYADLLMRNYDDGYNSLAKVIGGPAVNSASQLASTAYGSLSGDKGVEDWVNLAYKHTPYINLFYARPAIDYLIMFNLHEWLNPGKQQQVFDKREREQKQEYWLRP